MKVINAHFVCRLTTRATLIVLIVVSIGCNAFEIAYSHCKTTSFVRINPKNFDDNNNDRNNGDKNAIKECNSKIARIVLCFSLSSNIKLLFATSGPKRFVCIDAIRFLLIINVCVDHMYLFTPFLSTIAFRRILNSVIIKVYYYNKYFFARNILIIDTIFIIR